jgi:hypothetical protein
MEHYDGRFLYIDGYLVALLFVPADGVKRFL